MRKLIAWDLVTLDGYFEGESSATGAIADFMSTVQPEPELNSALAAESS